MQKTLSMKNKGVWDYSHLTFVDLLTESKKETNSQMCNNRPPNHAKIT